MGSLLAMLPRCFTEPSKVDHKVTRDDVLPHSRGNVGYVGHISRKSDVYNMIAWFALALYVYCHYRLIDLINQNQMLLFYFIGVTLNFKRLPCPSTGLSKNVFHIF